MSRLIVFGCGLVFLLSGGHAQAVQRYYGGSDGREITTSKIQRALHRTGWYRDMVRAKRQPKLHLTYAKGPDIAGYVNVYIAAARVTPTKHTKGAVAKERSYVVYQGVSGEFRPEAAGPWRTTSR